MESFQPTQTYVYQRAPEKRTADFLYWKNLEVCCFTLGLGYGARCEARGARQVNCEGPCEAAPDWL